MSFDKLQFRNTTKEVTKVIYPFEGYECDGLVLCCNASAKAGARRCCVKCVVGGGVVSASV